MLLVNAKMFSPFSWRVFEVWLEEAIRVDVKMLNNKHLKTEY
jgi:hypothetical protein